MKQISNKRIMVIGGDAHFLYLLQRYINTSAHQIVYANLDDDILVCARLENPSAIVLDVDPPASIGWKILKVLKADPEIGKIPVIVCSWLEEEPHGLELGADCYLRKPILYADFENALAIILGKSSSQVKEHNEKSI